MWDVQAILLAGLAMKKRWMERRKAQGKSIENPNLVMSQSGVAGPAPCAGTQHLLDISLMPVLPCR